jgi:tripartite-type tricarboxylate transporter receptor subunit TctC
MEPGGEEEGSVTKHVAKGMLVAALLTAGGSVHAQQADKAFFNGKTVTYIVATSPGGGYDTYGRLVAEYMQKYLPGSTFVVRNMPGAGHLVGTNALFASKPDGLTLGTFNTGLIYTQLAKHQGVKFDLTKMSWIGRPRQDEGHAELRDVWAGRREFRRDAGAHRHSQTADQDAVGLQRH